MPEPIPSLLVKNIDWLVTMDDQRRVIQNGWLLVQNNMIAAIGDAGEVTPEADKVLDAVGHIVLPGLVNTHHHFFQTMLRSVPVLQNVSLFPWLKDLYLLMGSLTDEMVYASSRLALAELVLSGCTTTEDHFYLAVNDTAFDTEIRAAQEMGIRFHLGRGSFSVGQSQGGLPPDDIVEDEDDILADCQRLVQTYHDPNPGAMVRIELAPCSPFSVSERLMRESAEMARKYGVGLHTHLAETKDEEVFCLEIYGKRPVDYAADLGWLGGDVWYAHGVHLNDSEIKRMANTGTAVAHCPCSNMRLGSGIARVRDMLQAGMIVGLGVDGSASNDSSHMLAEVRQAMLLQRVKYGADAMTATQALEVATLQGSKLLRRDDIGVLQPGMAADFIGVTLHQLGYAGALHDPVAALIFCTPAQVSFSAINGQVVVEGGQLLTADVETLINEQNRLAAELVKRTEKRFGRSFVERSW
ncbi:MAG: 8-oxoguanine deaminase [Chloroflexota bacterium]|nr:MAG: 8-oxoguanine deaminase [Chloroflexota bacterium]